jgi:hypothetical protein
MTTSGESVNRYTLYFDGQFWRGALELRDAAGAGGAGHVWGGEPTEPEVYAFACSPGYVALLDKAELARTTAQLEPLPRRPSPKRAAREAAREMAARPFTTAAQAAMQAAIEAADAQRREHLSATRAADEQLRRDRATAKAKARHRGH